MPYTILSIFLKYVGIPIAFVLYLLFQILIMNKKWKELESDALMMVVFAVIYYSSLYLIYKGI